VSIQSFRDDRMAQLFANTVPGKGFPTRLARVTQRKLKQLDAATSLQDLREPPSNRLHPLRRDRSGQHAIWVNEQYRLCFTWTAAGPADVEFVDYHD